MDDSPHLEGHWRNALGMEFDTEQVGELILGRGDPASPTWCAWYTRSEVEVFVRRGIWRKA